MSLEARYREAHRLSEEFPSSGAFAATLALALVHADAHSSVASQFIDIAERLYQDEAFHSLPPMPSNTQSITAARLDDFLHAYLAKCAVPERTLAAFSESLIESYATISEALPTTSSVATFSVPLIDFLTKPGEVVQAALAPFLGERTTAHGLFVAVRDQLHRNLCAASKLEYPPKRETLKRAIFPRASTLAPRELIDAYLKHTPFYELFLTPVPFGLADDVRFEHHWIVAGSGHGKTQTLQFLIAKDLEKVAAGEASVVVIDSQGDLIRNISRLKFFADNPNRLVLIDPTDIEYPVALNLFDVGMDRISGYAPLERERLLNGILELYDHVIGALLGAEFTQKQSVLFRYVTRLMLHIPNATIHTFREIMEPGGYEKYSPYIDRLSVTARAFFETEFQSKQFEETKRQVVRRLWGILENSTLERMFSHPRNKLDLFSELNAGKVILISTAKDLLKQQGAELLGRFFIAMIAQAAQERATLSERKPTFVYVDEAQDYFDANVGHILEQARKFKVGIILAHQYVGQLTPRLQESFAANTSIKFAGGLSDRDARLFAGMLRCDPEFIEAQSRGHFAAFVRNHLGHAISLNVPFGALEEMERMTGPEWQRVCGDMRARFASRYSPSESEQTLGNLQPSTAFEIRAKEW